MFGRSLGIIIGDIGIYDLRVNFSVVKSLVGYPNLATIKIYNLKESTRNLLKEEGINIELYAGYTDTPLLFSGDIVNVISLKQGVDWLTELYCKDSITGINDATINKTFPAGSTQEQIFDGLVGKMQGVTKGITEGLTSCVSGKQSLLRALQVSGNVKDWLKNIAEQ